jgi:two-component system, NarL family, sensor kinase
MFTNQNYLWLGTLLVFFILGFIIIFFIYSLVIHQRKFIILQKERMRAEVEALEKERKRVAKDLHDSLGPFLSAIKFQINSMDTQIPHDIDIIEKASGHIDNMVTDIRRIANNLNPNILHDKGLHAAISDFIKNIKSATPVKINYYNSTHTTITFTEEASVHIYRILQEIITNTIKHAQATEVLIKMYEKNKQCILLTQDNGKGFNTKEKNEQSTGHGLKNLATRTELLSGTFNITSEVGKGTTTIFEFNTIKISQKI